MARNTWLFYVLLGCSFAPLTYASAQDSPVFDVHTHFNWDHEEITSPQDIQNILEKHNVTDLVIMGTPNEQVLKIKKALNINVIALFSPYITHRHRKTWFGDMQVIELAEKALASGAYSGIGEIHFMDGFRPDFDNKVFLGLLAVALKHQVPVMIHIDHSNPARFIRLCQEHQDLDIILAHAGGIYQPTQLIEIIDKCENVWIDLSARDPWHYDRLVDTNGKLRAGWVELLNVHANRFLLGTDPVWGVTRTQRWDQADDGWLKYDQLLQFQLNILKQIDKTSAERIRYSNARLLFRKKPGISKPD
jgi:hypothetical protein